MTKRMEQKAEQYAYRLEQFRLRLQLHSPQSQLNERRQYLEDARVRMARQMEKRCPICAIVWNWCAAGWMGSPR